MKRNLISILFAITLLIPKINQATVIVSNGTGGGPWDDASTWSPSAPVCGDSIVILASDVVDIETQLNFAGCGSAMYISVFGTLDFNTNGMKLKLPCNSKVTIEIGGLLTSSGNGGGSNNRIDICVTEVWKKSNGDQPGFHVFYLPTPLPITLLSFEAELDNTSIVISWKTSTEKNNDFFTIERSKNGLSFEIIEEIPGSGNSNTLMDYQAYDDSPIMGTSYYRLKQTDFDGKFEYFNLIAVNFSQNKEGICNLHIYPNPCIGSCKVDLKDCPLENNQVNVELFDALGKKIVNRITPETNNNQNVSFHLNTSNNLAPGIYIIKSSANGNTKSSQVIVK